MQPPEATSARPERSDEVLGAKSRTVTSPFAAEDVAAPTAMTAMVGSARHALRAVQSSGLYPPELAVEAVEEATAVLHRLSAHVEPYVGDYSHTAAKSLLQARESLKQARVALSDARHALSLDLVFDVETTSAAPVPIL
ncbi:hypothetical protein [Plantactinospora sp. CA-290183]|uniref:hypothetical protein n=1 Tax=Plantactinospora sp. CA-290183 TaxID=3240006 RepID=UPI003D89C62E